MDLILLLSGPVAVGKSSLACELILNHEFRAIRTGAFLLNRLQAVGEVVNRTALQDAGDRLDQQTDFEWVVSAVAVPTIAEEPSVRRWLLDSVRKQQQVEHFRSRYGSAVSHVHLTAPDAFLKDRYEVRRASGEGYAAEGCYEDIARHPNEVAVRSLLPKADS